MNNIIPKTRVVGVSGGLGRPSTQHTALLHCLSVAETLGARTDLIDLCENPFPPMNPSQLKELQTSKCYIEGKALIQNCDSLLLATPDYHGSMSGTLKNFLDFYWKEFAGKLFGTICTSFEKGLTVTDHLRTCIRQCYGWSLPYSVNLSDPDANVSKTQIINEKVSERIEQLAYDLVHYGPLLREQFKLSQKSEENNVGFAGHYRKN